MIHNHKTKTVGPKENNLSSFQFGWSDSLFVATAFCFLFAHLYYINGEYAKKDNFFSFCWIVSIFVIGARLVKPVEGSPRVPFLIWIVVGIAALAFNYWRLA